MKKKCYACLEKLPFRKKKTLNDLLGFTMLLRTVDTEKWEIAITEMLRNDPDSAKSTSPTMNYFSFPCTLVQL